MGYQIIQQPNDKLALFSSSSDMLCMVNATPQDLIDYFAESELVGITFRTNDICEMLANGEKPYYQFTQSWNHVLEKIRDLHHDDELIDQEELIALVYKKEVIVEIGTEIILLKNLHRDNTHYSAKSMELATVVAVDEETIILSVHVTEYRTRVLRELTITLEDVQDAERFLILKEMRIDDLKFSNDVPKEAGFYWFYGIKRNGSSKVSLINVSVKGKPDRLHYWFGGDMQFASKLEMKGLWAKAYRPTLPTIKG